MKPSLLLCIPGPWKERLDFQKVLMRCEPKGRFLFAGQILADTVENDHVSAEFQPDDPMMARAFTVAGQGRFSEESLSRIGEHASVLYMHFAQDLVAERERILKFTGLLESNGGLALKVESSGIAHALPVWRELLTGSDFDLYRSVVGLIGSEDQCYSCCMHLLGKPECAVSTDLDVGEAADLINQFNYWQIIESPVIQSGQTFSLAPDASRYRLVLTTDSRHYGDDDPFYNPHGIWDMEVI